MTDKDLAESLAEYILEELDNINIEILGGQVCIYTNTSDVLSDGSFLSTYMGSIQIVGDKIMFMAGGRSPTSRDTICMQSFDLNVPDSFDHMFEKIKEIIKNYSKIKII